MTVALLVVTDGRDEALRRCLESFTEYVRGDVTERWMHDDTGDPDYRAELVDRYPSFTHINAGPRRGFGAAIHNAWTLLGAGASARHVFHLEADFLFRRRVDLDAMARVLDSYPHLAQMALRRQPWNSDEKAAGGLVELHPDWYTEVSDPDGDWLEHRGFWTTNPSLYRRSLCRLGWPKGPQSEGRFGIQLLTHGSHDVAGPDIRFGFWGRRDSGEWVEHIGHQRVGMGY